MGESHQRQLISIVMGDTLMPRISAACLTVLLLLGPASARAFEVFQDPDNSGTNPGGPVRVSGTTGLNLFIHRDGVAADPNGACSGTAAAGDEFCGWDLHIVSSGVTLDSFVPEPGTDIVFNLTSGELRGNGGDPLLGQVGTHRIGTLTVTADEGAVGSVDVVGNLYVTSFLQTATILSNPLATAGECLDSDGDGVCDAEDNCIDVANPRVLSPPAWMTLTGGQRDDDGDGYGNICDGKFDTPGTNVGQPDVGEFVASLGKNRATFTCGTSGSDNCARYDLDEGAATNIGQPDVGVFISLLGKPPGPRCAGCPLP